MKKDDYVTHEELNHAVDKLSDQIKLVEAHIDTKFAEQENKQIKWFIATIIAIVGLIHFFN